MGLSAMFCKLISVRAIFTISCFMFLCGFIHPSEADYRANLSAWRNVITQPWLNKRPQQEQQQQHQYANSHSPSARSKSSPTNSKMPPPITAVDNQKVVKMPEERLLSSPRPSLPSKRQTLFKTKKPSNSKRNVNASDAAPKASVPNPQWSTDQHGSTEVFAESFQYGRKLKTSKRRFTQDQSVSGSTSTKQKVTTRRTDNVPKGSLQAPPVAGKRQQVGPPIFAPGFGPGGQSRPTSSNRVPTQAVTANVLPAISALQSLVDRPSGLGPRPNNSPNGVNNNNNNRFTNSPPRQFTQQRGPPSSALPSTTRELPVGTQTPSAGRPGFISQSTPGGNRLQSVNNRPSIGAGPRSTAPQQRPNQNFNRLQAPPIISQSQIQQSRQVQNRGPPAQQLTQQSRTVSAQQRVPFNNQQQQQVTTVRPAPTAFSPPGGTRNPTPSGNNNRFSANVRQRFPLPQAPTRLFAAFGRPAQTGVPPNNNNNNNQNRRPLSTPHPVLSLIAASRPPEASRPDVLITSSSVNSRFSPPQGVILLRVAPLQPVGEVHGDGWQPLTSPGGSRAEPTVPGQPAPLFNAILRNLPTPPQPARPVFPTRDPFSTLEPVFPGTVTSVPLIQVQTPAPTQPTSLPPGFSPSSEFTRIADSGNVKRNLVFRSPISVSNDDPEGDSRKNRLVGFTGGSSTSSSFLDQEELDRRNAFSRLAKEFEGFDAKNNESTGSSNNHQIGTTTRFGDRPIIPVTITSGKDSNFFSPDPNPDFGRSTSFLQTYQHYPPFDNPSQQLISTTPRISSISSSINKGQATSADSTRGPLVSLLQLPQQTSSHQQQSLRNGFGISSDAEIVQGEDDPVVIRLEPVDFITPTSKADTGDDLVVAGEDDPVVIRLEPVDFITPTSKADTGDDLVVAGVRLLNSASTLLTSAGSDEANDDDDDDFDSNKNNSKDDDEDLGNQLGKSSTSFWRSELRQRPDLVPVDAKLDDLFAEFHSPFPRVSMSTEFDRFLAANSKKNSGF
ncbi:unnamed protein product [Notodromas monacha]|uniref:Uncharacterized protein n=1 Tax=Notodromas monacha TaxID=399045 RepID=A0A7R9BKJ7_9CRUS|nr:unnamed protein product [Notodromas monacha]CAG0917185.1 unnamed protein product [Notodromas monacha]